MAHSLLSLFCSGLAILLATIGELLRQYKNDKCEPFIQLYLLR